MELPQLVVELVGDYSKLMEDIKRARVEAVKQAQFIEKDLNLTIGVNDDSLKNLNKHFDLKVTHFKQTQTYFKNNPLKVFVDDNSLTKLNKDLDKLGRKKTNINVSNSGGESSGDVRVSIDNNTDNKEIINSLKSIENAIKAQSKQSLLGSAASGIFAGFTEDIGRNISRMTTRKGVGKIVSKIQAGFKVIDEEIIGKSQVYETFLAELLRNGQVGKAFDVASKRTTIYKQQQRLGKLQVLSDETKTPKEREGAFDQILKEEPALQEQYNSYKAKFSTKSEAEVKKSFIPTVLDKAQPTSISQKVVMPLINEFQPLLRFIQGMQSYNTSVLSQQFYNERKPAFPILGKGENVVSVFGGAENKKGQGGRAIATSLEPLMPGLRFMPVENLDTDATERTADVDNFIKSLLTKFAPDLLSSSSTITNSARQVAYSLNPLASSVGAAQALANTKLAKEQGAEASALSFSLGGADAYRYAKTAEYEGIDTKTMAMAYPFVNFAGAPPKNFKSAILNPDPLSFPFKLGLNNPTPEANILKDTTLPPSASVHGVHHLFKSPQFRTVLGETTGVMPVGRDGKVMSRTQQQGSGLQQILIDLERSKKSLSQGFVDIDSVETLSAAKSKLKKYSSEGTEVAKVVAEKLEKEIDEIIERIKEFFKSKNINIPDDLTDLKNFSRYVSEVNKINNNLLSFKSGKKLDNDTGYFSGGLDVATVAERKRELQLETLPWFKSQNFGEYSPIINSGFENLLSVQDEFVKTGGKLSPETIQGINPIPLPKGSEELLEMQRKVKKDFPSEKFNEENIRLASIPAPDSLKKYPATILAFNKMVTSLGAMMPDASEIKTVGFGFGSQAATTLMTDKLAYKTTLDPDGAKKIASEQEIKAYEKLRGRHSPLLYAAKPGEALVTEKIKGTLLRDILESMAEPIKVMQEELSKETNSDKQKEIGARVRDAKKKFNTIAEQLYYNVGQLGGAMHKMGVAHNDLTSGNVFFDKFTVNPSNNKVQFGEGGEGGGVKAIDLERATVNPNGIEQAQDQLTTIEKVFSDPSFRGILDPIRTTKAITSGYANPLPIPEVRQINPKLLTPQKPATQIPIGYSGRSMLQEITGNLQPTTILPTYALGKPYTPTPVNIPNGYQTIRTNPTAQPTSSKDIEMSEKANLAVKSAQELAAKFNANFTRLKSLLKDAEKTGNFAPVIELSAAIKQYGDKAKSDIEKLRNSAELSSNFATGKSSAQLAQAAGQISSVQNKAARISALHGGVGVGENVTKGVSEGLESSLKDLRASSEKLANTVINTVEEKLEIKSPSRWGIRVGENIGDAMGMGADKSLNKFKTIIASKISEMRKGVEGVSPTKFNYATLPKPFPNDNSFPILPTSYKPSTHSPQKRWTGVGAPPADSYKPSTHSPQKRWTGVGAPPADSYKPSTHSPQKRWTGVGAPPADYTWTESGGWQPPYESAPSVVARDGVLIPELLGIGKTLQAKNKPTSGTPQSSLSHTIPGARKRGTEPQLPNTSFVPPAYTAPRVPQSISFKIPNTTTPQTTQLPPFLPDGIPQIPQAVIENSVKKNSEPFARFGTMLGKYLGDGFVKGLKFLEGSDSNGIIPAFIRIIDGLKSAVESGDMTSTAERFKNRFSRAFSKGLGSIPGFAEAKERFNIYKDFLKEVANPNVSAALGEGLANGIVGAKELFVDFLKMPEKLVEGFNQVKVAFDSFVEGMNKVQKFGEIMDFLKSSIGNVVKILGLLVVGKIILDLAPASIEVAANFENLERRIKFTSGSISEGAKNIAFLRSEAKRLNVDLSQTLESGSKFFQATKDTPLEGFQSRQIVSAVTQASAVYGLDLDKQQRTFTALEQMTGKTVVSQEELRQQLAEAIPNASQIAANAYGTTTQSMNQLLSTGRVLAEDFLPKFAQQLKAQTSSGVGDAVNSSVAITNKFNNSLIELQESIGKTLLPFRNFSLSVFATGIDLVTKNFGLLQAVIAMTLIKLSSPVWMMFGAYLKEIPFSLNLIKSAATSMGGAILGIGKAILMFSVQIALVMVALKAFEVGWRQFTDTSGAIGEQTRNVAQTVAERRKKMGVIVPPKPDPNYLDRAGLFYDGTGKQLNDSTERVFEGQQNSIDILNDSNSPAIQAAIQEIQAIDKALDAIKMKRRAVIANNPGDIQALRVLQEQEKELSQKREKPLELFGGNKANLDKQVETLKSYLEYFQEARKDSRLYADEVERIDELIGYVGEDLATVTKEQDRMTKAIKNSLTEMQKFAIEIRSLEAKFNDLRQSRDTALSVEKTGLFDLASSGNITPGQNEYTANLKTQSNLIGKIGDNLKQIREMSAQLEIKGLSDVLSTQGLTKNSGIDALKAAEEKAIDGSKEKEILQGYIKVREMQVQTIDMQMQLSEQKYNLTQSLYQQNKQITDYYLNLNKQAQEITQVYKELVNTNNLNTAKNKIRSAVLGYQDNFITQFADSIIQILDTLNQPVVALLQGQREIDQAKFNLLNEKRQIQETQRSNLSPITPGNGKVTSEFGWRTIFGQRQHHNGIDYGVPIGTPVKAPTSGKVSNVFNDVGGGLTVTLSNINAAGQKVEQSFLHLSQSLVKIGDAVQKGQVIAKSGNSGSRTTGAHLDYRVKVDGKYINPRDFLKSSAQLPVIPKNLPKPLAKDGSVEFAAPQPQPTQGFVSPQLQQAERNLQNTITNAQTKINIEASQSYITATAQENKALMALDRARMENRRSPIGVFREIQDMGLNLSQQNPEREWLSQKFQIERNGEDKLHQITMAKFDQENIKGANEDLLAKVRENTTLRPAFKAQAIKQLESVVAESKKIIEEYDEYLKLVPELTAAAIEKLNSEYLISENLRKFSLNQQISQAQASALRSKSRGNLQLNSQADSMDLNSKYAGEISGLDEEIRKESDPEMIKLKQEQKKLALIAALRDGSNIQRNLKIQERDLEFSQKEKLISSNNAISSEVIKGKGLFGVKDKNLEKAQALSQIKMDFEREKMEIEKLGESGNYSSDYIEKLTNNLNKLNELKLDNVTKEFNMFTEAISGVKGDVDGIFKDFFMNTKSFGESISAVFQSILNNLANMASKELSNQLFSSVLGMGGKSSGGGGGGGFSSGGFDFSSGFDLGGGLDFGSAELPSFAKGGMVGDLLNKERSLSGFNPRLIIANEGERVLTPKETKLWNQLNSSNKLESFSSGGMVGQGLGNINNVGRSGDTINITPNVNINNEGGGNINKALFEKALEAKIQETIKQERRPGGSLNRGGLYDR